MTYQGPTPVILTPTLRGQTDSIFETTGSANAIQQNTIATNFGASGATTQTLPFITASNFGSVQKFIVKTSQVLNIIPETSGGYTNRIIDSLGNDISSNVSCADMGSEIILRAGYFDAGNGNNSAWVIESQNGNWLELPFSPTDESGASLTFTSSGYQIQQTGNRIDFSVSVTIPVNGSGLGFTLGGLPYTNKLAGFGKYCFSVVAALPTTALVGQFNSSGYVNIFDSVANATITNIQLSGLVILMTGFYFIQS